jgi:hypothetical protein
MSLDNNYPSSNLSPGPAIKESISIHGEILGTATVGPGVKRLTSV